jgi:hypothetical protein
MPLTSLNGLGYGGAAGQRLNMVLQELQAVKTAVLTGAAAATAIALPTAEYTDTILSVIRFAAGVPSDVTAEASIVDRRATGTLTLSGAVIGDLPVVNGKTYTAIAAQPAANSGANLPGTFQIGATDTATAANLAAAINARDSATVIATANAAVVTIKAVAPGVGGNAIALGNVAHFTRSAATLAGGTATNAIVLSTTNTTGNQLLVQWAKKPSAAI